MRILVVDEEVPYPLNTGKRIRTLNLLKPLAQRHEITFVCRRHEGTDSQSLDHFGIRTVIIPHPIRQKSGPGFYAALLANLASPYPYSVSSHFSPMMVSTLKKIWAEKRFDLIHCEWTPYAINLQPLLPFASVVDAHNVETQVWKRNWEVERHPLKKAFIYLQWKKMERFEKIAFPLFSRAIAVSETDKALMATWVRPENIKVVENGVDIGYFKPTGVKPRGGSLVFVGSLDWRPNVDAMLYFLKGVWPEVLQRYSAATLTIVGRNPAPVLVDRAGKLKSVILTGTVDDVRQYMAEAMVFIVPLRVGGGSRLKILEALAMQKPVVSTSVGAEGLEVSPGENILTADSPSEFAAAIGRLFTDEALRVRLGEAGRRLVEERYQWGQLSRKLETTWLEVVDQREGLN